MPWRRLQQRSRQLQLARLWAVARRSWWVKLAQLLEPAEKLYNWYLHTFRPDVAIVVELSKEAGKLRAVETEIERIWKYEWTRESRDQLEWLAIARPEALFIELIHRSGIEQRNLGPLAPCSSVDVDRAFERNEKASEKSGVLAAIIASNLLRTLSPERREVILGALRSNEEVQTGDRTVIMWEKAVRTLLVHAYTMRTAGK